MQWERLRKLLKITHLLSQVLEHQLLPLAQVLQGQEK